MLLTPNHVSKPEDLMFQNGTLSGNQRPDLVTSLMNMSRPLRLPREMHLSRSSSNVLRPLSCPEMLHDRFFFFIYDKVQTPFDLPRKTGSERPNVLRTHHFFFPFLTSKCVSRHNSVHFFNISVSKNGPRMVCVLCILTSK